MCSGRKKSSFPESAARASRADHFRINFSLLHWCVWRLLQDASWRSRNQRCTKNLPYLKLFRPILFCETYTPFAGRQICARTHKALPRQQANETQTRRWWRQETCTQAAQTFQSEQHPHPPICSWQYSTQRETCSRAFTFIHSYAHAHSSIHSWAIMGRTNASIHHLQISSHSAEIRQRPAQRIQQHFQDNNHAEKNMHISALSSSFPWILRFSGRDLHRQTCMHSWAFVQVNACTWMHDLPISPRFSCAKTESCTHTCNWKHVHSSTISESFHSGIADVGRTPAEASKVRKYISFLLHPSVRYL